MKTKIVFGILAITGSSLLAADSSPKDQVASAVKKLAQAENYSWKSTMEFGNFGGTTEGKTDKEGVIALSMSFGDNTTEAFLKSGKGAVKRADQEWQSLSDLIADSEGQRGRAFLARRLQNLKSPAVEAADLLSKVKDLKQEGDAYSGELTEEGAKDLLLAGRHRGGDAPEPKNAKGTVKFWTKDVTLTKYELKQQGTITFNGNERDIDGTTTIEIKDIGKTKFEIPEAAKKKMT